MDKTFQEIIKESLDVINEFKKVEKKEWTPEVITLELTKQIGELSKHIIMHEGYYMAGRDKLRFYETSKEHIGDELSDILFMTIRLADYYKIDLEKEHLKQLKIAMEHPLMKVKK